jgi:hypothetical protein
MKPRDADPLIEAALTAWRPRAPDGRILPHPAWADLSPADRERLYEETLRARALEQGMDLEGLSTTARRVMSTIGRVD